jgi:hypothetical protein
MPMPTPCDKNYHPLAVLPRIDRHKGYVKKVFPPLRFYACAVGQLPRHLLGRFLSLRYLAVKNSISPSQLPWTLAVLVDLSQR